MALCYNIYATYVTSVYRISPQQQCRATETMTHRQASLTFTADSSLSSGFASDLSSVAASSRFPSFSLASLESLEGTDLAWLSALDPNSSDFLKRNKNLESSTLQRKSRRK